jgi:hypothetical protein
MKKFLLKISSVLIACIVLFSTASFTISEHYCGGNLVDSSVFSKAKSCSLDMEISSSTEGCIIQKDNCCEDLVIQVEGQNELISLATDLNFNQQVFIASFVYSYINLFEELANKNVNFKDYTPPLVNNDLQVLFQTFLI